MRLENHLNEPDRKQAQKCPKHECCDYAQYDHSTISDLIRVGGYLSMDGRNIKLPAIYWVEYDPENEIRGVGPYGS